MVQNKAFRRIHPKKEIFCLGLLLVLSDFHSSLQRPSLFLYILHLIWQYTSLLCQVQRLQHRLKPRYQPREFHLFGLGGFFTLEIVLKLLLPFLLGSVFILFNLSVINS
jgi:hypothetical protein